MRSSTSTEATVAEADSRGAGAKRAVVALGMAPSTPRWHLKAVFEKTDAAR